MTRLSIMKKFALIPILLMMIAAASAQDFPGYRTGNYTGVNGVFYNPANIADSRYNFDINLISFNSLIGNNQASFKLKNLSQSFQGDSLRNQIFGKNAGPSSGMLSLDIHGPSFMFNINDKTSIAITTRARAFANVTDCDGKLADKISSDFNNDPELPYTLASSQNMRVAVNAWSEYGVSVARVIVGDGPHFLKAGITLKYLAGAGNGYINIDHFNGTIDKDLLQQDAYLSNTSGRIGVGFGGINIDDFSASDLTKMKSSGFGSDIGFVYEFRPDCIDKNPDPDKKSCRNPSDYKFKLGLSILDIGKIKYKKDAARSGAYDIDINNGERLYLSQLADEGLDNYNEFFSSRPQYFTPVGASDGSYSVSLPTTLQLEADYNIHGGFFLSLASQIAINADKTKGYNSQSYSGVALTPRYESRIFGFYLPVQYNELTKLNAGISLRFGPVFIGSGSVLTALMSESKQADIHFGLRFGGLKRS
ncbi:MAG: DUF5723 family protein [Flavitalea sp.]